jgi:hypothetical protein
MPNLGYRLDAPAAPNETGARLANCRGAWAVHDKLYLVFERLSRLRHL